jgi:hypothetical protein
LHFSVAITAETAIIILYAAAAVVPITQFAPDPLSAAILAHGAQVVAANINVAARLRIAAYGNKPSASACTLEPAIIVNNIANALVEAVERAFHPVSPHGLADSAKGISVSLDIAAALRIRSARAIAVVAIAISIAIVVPVSVPIAVPVTIMLAAVVHAAKLAIDIFNRAAATGEGFEMSIHPLAVAVLAASAQNVIAHANFTAGLVVSAAGHRAIFVANQVAIVVGNIAPAAIGGIQKRVMIVPARILAASAQVIAPQAYVSAGLLVGSSRIIIIHGGSAGFQGPTNDQHRKQGNQRQISH